MKTNFVRQQLPASLVVAFCALHPLAHLQAAQAVVTPSLDEVRVSAARFHDPVADAPPGVSVINADEIRRSGVTTINEAIAKLLGVQSTLDFYGGGNTSMDLRGFGSTAVNNQVIVLDGVRLSEADLAAPRLSGIAIDTVERIEVWRSGGAVLYGEGATGGVIVITTKAGDGRERRNQGSVYGAVGSHNLKEWRAQTTLSSGSFSADVSLQRRDGDNHRDNHRSETNGGQVSLQWSGDAARFGISHGQDRLRGGLPGGLTWAQYMANPSQAASQTDRSTIENDRQVVFGEVMLDDWRIAGEWSQRSKTLRSEFSGWAGGHDVDARNAGLRARHQGQWGIYDSRLTLGLETADWKRLDVGAARHLTHQSNAWYVHNELRDAQGRSLYGGWRTEKLEKQSGSTTLAGREHAWSLGLKSPLFNNVTGWVQMGDSFRLANVDEFAFTTPNTTLRAQTSRDLEAGVEGRWDTMRWQLRAYRMSLNNEIGYDPTVANSNSWSGFGANVNFDPTLRRGLELDVDGTINARWSWKVRLGVREATFRSGAHAGKGVPLVAGPTLAVSATWLPAEGHSVSAFINSVGRAPVDFANSCHVPSRTTLAARYVVALGRHAEWAISADNLTDRKYFSLAYGCAGGLPSAIYPEAGRTFSTSLRLAF